jgi:hypothetical protein
MFGVPIVKDHATNVFCDNESIVKNATKIESILNKKHSSVFYHYIRWAVADGIILVAWIPTGENLSVVFTKRLAEAVRDHLFGNFTY